MENRLYLSALAEYLQRDYFGTDCVIGGFNLCNRDIVLNDIVSYCTSLQYWNIALKNDKIRVLICPYHLYKTADIAIKENLSFILSDNAEWDFYKAYLHYVKNYFQLSRKSVISDISDVSIGVGAVVENNVKIGKNVVIGHNSVIKSGSIIGDNVHIGNCSVIGEEGFQLIKDNEGNNRLIPHIGGVLICDDVSIGDNVTITRSLFEGFTTIEKFVKIDNHVHVAHNCSIGENSVITAGSVMFGSSKIGKNVWVAPNCSIMNRVEVGDNAFICACSFIWRNVKANTKMSGNPAHRIN